MQNHLVRDLSFAPYEYYSKFKEVFCKIPRFKVERVEKESYESEIITDEDTGVLIAEMFKHKYAQAPRCRLHFILMGRDLENDCKQLLKRLSYL